MIRFYHVLFYALVLVFVSCDKNETDLSDPTELTGTGAYTFDNYAPFADKPIDCFYHIPPNSNSITPLLIILPGAGRDASQMRDGLINSANQKGFMVLSLRFSEAYFPGSSKYNLANIYEDGDDPTPATLNDPEEWTFAVIDPIFEDFKALLGSSITSYDIFGHSAGAQLLHRFLIFDPNAKYNRLVISAAGWYNMPDNTVDFPYGIASSPAADESMAPVFARSVYVTVGADDIDPNSFNLRHTPEADLQGNNRFERAQYFYLESRDIAIANGLEFNWQYSTAANVGHNGIEMSNYAAGILY